MLPYRTAKKESQHEVPTTPIDYLQMGSTLPRNLEAEEVNIRKPSTSEVRKIKNIDLGLVKMSEEDRSLAHGT